MVSQEMQILSEEIWQHSDAHMTFLLSAGDFLGRLPRGPAANRMQAAPSNQH